MSDFARIGDLIDRVTEHASTVRDRLDWAEARAGDPEELREAARAAHALRIAAEALETAVRQVNR